MISINNLEPSFGKKGGSPTLDAVFERAMYRSLSKYRISIIFLGICLLIALDYFLKGPARVQMRAIFKEYSAITPGTDIDVTAANLKIFTDSRVGSNLEYELVAESGEINDLLFFWRVFYTSDYVLVIDYDFVTMEVRGKELFRIIHRDSTIVRRFRGIIGSN